MNVLLALLWSMLKIGCFAFGGGYAIIALLEGEFITKRKWIEHDEFMDVVAIAESTPGPIAINVATYVGYKLKGFLGATIATVGICAPSFVIMYVVSLFYEQFSRTLWCFHIGQQIVALLPIGTAHCFKNGLHTHFLLVFYF